MGVRICDVEQGLIGPVSVTYAKCSRGPSVSVGMLRNVSLRADSVGVLEWQIGGCGVQIFRTALERGHLALTVRACQLTLSSSGEASLGFRP